jgi:DNA topoisomerase VI subunit B
MGNATLTRTTFEMSRALEFFTERELTMQPGFPRLQWGIALTKELSDNGLDACEKAGVAPEITVTLDGSTLTVHDTGPGLPETTLRGSLDYLVRVSDNAYYVSPSRGQLGNALKCVWAAPYVMSRDRIGRVDVETGGDSIRLPCTWIHSRNSPRSPSPRTCPQREKRALRSPSTSPKK